MSESAILTCPACQDAVWKRQAKYEKALRFLEAMTYFCEGDYNGLSIEWAHNAKELLKELGE